uniref:Uncharacterized protein n=1 Tax=Romanomermis culicivorax TaxID=13658 RepID=A0A915JES8_ROMCU
MHSHLISMGKSSGDNEGGINAFAMSHEELLALGRQISQAENSIDIQTIESREYELIPQPKNVENRTGIKMNLMKSERLELQKKIPNFSPDATTLTNFEQIRLDPLSWRRGYEKIRNAVN